jgi:hypothetical protein
MSKCIFIADLFANSKTWKHPKCAIDEWINKLCHTQIMEHNSALGYSWDIAQW